MARETTQDAAAGGVPVKRLRPTRAQLKEAQDKALAAAAEQAKQMIDAAADEARAAKRQKAKEARSRKKAD